MGGAACVSSFTIMHHHEVIEMYFLTVGEMASKVGKTGVSEMGVGEMGVGEQGISRTLNC